MSRFNDLVVQLNADDTHARLLAIRQLRQSGKPEAIAALATVLDDSSVAIVRTAVLALGHLGSCGIVDAIVPLLQHEHQFVRLAVVQALGMSGCGDAVPLLVTLMEDETLHATAREALVALKVDPDFF